MTEETSPIDESDASDEVTTPPEPEATWDDLGLAPDIRSAIDKRGYEKPTLVQAKAVPAALTGDDCLVRAKTGSGKTAAFLMPALQRIPAGRRKHSLICLAPTRELAIQIAEEAKLLTVDKDLKVITIYGGVPMGPQVDALEAGHELIIGTPGRVLDHIRRGNLKLEDALVGILDEADEMLSMGFFKEVTDILSNMPETGQILLFSATVEEKLKQLIGKYLKDPQELYLSIDEARVNPDIHHVLYETTMAYPKPRQVLHIMEVEKPTSAIIFCNTRSDTDTVARFLSRQGIGAEPISSDLTQKARERVMGRIKRGDIDVLCATDIAARGIDVSDLTHVINYSLPEDPAVYLHRTGRTGRAGKEGTAVSLMSGKELGTRNVLVRTYGIQFEERVLPDREQVDEQWTERHVEDIKRAVHEGLAFEGFLGMARRLREKGPAGDALVAAALRGFFEWQRKEERRKKAVAAGEDPEQVEKLMNERVGKGAPRSGGGGRGGPRGGGGRGGPRGGGGRR